MRRGVAISALGRDSFPSLLVPLTGLLARSLADLSQSRHSGKEVIGRSAEGVQHSEKSGYLDVVPPAFRIAYSAMRNAHAIGGRLQGKVSREPQLSKFAADPL